MTGPESTEAAPERGKRARHRVARTREYLSTALDIVTTEGFDALTMQRLADQCDAAIGAVYRYFPSKGALVAEVQREAVERLATSYELIRARSDQQFLNQELDGAALALARLATMGRWFLALVDTHPQELRLMHMLLTEWRPVVTVEEGMRVLPSVMRLLDRARSCVEDAVEAGALNDDADSMVRVVIWAASVGGVMETSRLDVYDAELFSGGYLALTLTNDLFRAWGADPRLLSQAHQLVDAVSEDGTLAPVPQGGNT